MWHFGTARTTDILLTRALKPLGAMSNDASAELKFLLTREKVDESIQKTLYTAGVTSISEQESSTRGGWTSRRARVREGQRVSDNPHAGCVDWGERAPAGCVNKGRGAPASREGVVPQKGAVPPDTVWGAQRPNQGPEGTDPQLTGVKHFSALPATQH